MPPDEKNQASTAPNRPPQNQPANPPPPSASPPPQQPAPISTEPLITSPQEPPPTTPTAAPKQNQTPPEVTYPKSTKRLFFSLLAVLLAITAITLGGGIALAYKNYPLITPPKIVKETLDNIIAISPLPKPTRLIIESTFAKTAAIKSADLKTEFSLTANSENSPVESMKLTLEGPAQFDNPESKASEFDIGLEVKFEGASFNGAASVKTVEDRVYFKINEIPFGQMYQQFISYKDKWYYWDIPQEYRQKEEDKAVSDNINKLISDFVNKSESWTTLTSKDGDFYEMEIKPPKDEVVNLIYVIVQAYEPKDQEKLVSDLEKEKLKEALDKVNDLKFTMKVNKDTYLLNNLSAQFNLATDDFSLPTRADSLLPQNQLVLNFNLTAELTNHNKNVVVIPPSGAINVEDAIKELGVSLGQDLNPQELPCTNCPETAPEATPPPLPIPTDDELSPEATDESALDEKALQSLIAPEETILGEKYNWEQELLKLFYGIIN